MLGFKEVGGVRTDDWVRSVRKRGGDWEGDRYSKNGMKHSTEDEHKSIWDGDVQVEEQQHGEVLGCNKARRGLKRTITNNAEGPNEYEHFETRENSLL